MQVLVLLQLLLLIIMNGHNKYIYNLSPASDFLLDITSTYIDGTT